MLCLCVWVCVGSSRLVSPWRNTVSYGPVSFSTFDWGHWQRLRRAACGMWCAASLAAAFNLVSGQSTLIFIYSTYSAHTHTHPYCHRHRHLFGFFVHTQDQPVCYTSISVCVCACILCKIHIQFASWTSVQISNIDYKYLPAWQPEVQSIPHLICSSAVAFTLNCNYVWLCVYVILFAQLQHTHIQ